MDLETAKTLAISRMGEHSLIEEGWTFRFDNAVKRIALCRYELCVITMSQYFTLHANEDQVEQAMLHEIAHAILPAEVGHDRPWQIMAKAIGYRGHRTMCNPYVEARIKAGIHPGSPASEVPLIPPPRTPFPEVEIGSVFSYGGKNYTVYKKGSKRWHAIAPGEIRKMMVPFEMAHVFLISENNMSDVERQKSSDRITP